MIKYKAEMKSKSNVLYSVRLRLIRSFEGQNYYWVVVKRMCDKELLSIEDVWGEKEAIKLWLAKCEELHEVFSNGREPSVERSLRI